MTEPQQDLRFLQQGPFNLDENALAWVQETYAKLDEDARVRQLFCFRSDGGAQDEHEYLGRYKPGGIIRIFGPDRNLERSRVDALQQDADVGCRRFGGVAHEPAIWHAGSKPTCTSGH